MKQNKFFSKLFRNKPSNQAVQEEQEDPSDLVITDPVTALAAVLFGLYNYEAMEEINRNLLGDIYTQNQASVKLIYFDLLYQNLEVLKDYEIGNLPKISEIVQSYSMPVITKLLNEYTQHYISLQEYEKCQYITGLQGSLDKNFH